MVDQPNRSCGHDLVGDCHLGGDHMKLLRIEEAAKILDVPVASLRTVAHEHGFIIRMGRALRIESDRIGELIEKCRVGQRAQGCTGEPQAVTESRSGKSETDQREFRPAQIAARKLKKPSPRTSNENIAQLVPLHRT